MESLWRGFVNANAATAATNATANAVLEDVANNSANAVVAAANSANAVDMSEVMNSPAIAAAAAPVWLWLASAFGGIAGLLILLLLFAWYRGAFTSAPETTENKQPTSKPQPSWCYVGTDNNTRVCVAVGAPSSCGDITTYASHAACIAGKLPVV